MAIKFGPAGNSDSFAAAGFKATVDAPKWLQGLGLNAYEYQCGRGVNVGEETARKIGAQAAAHGITLSLHTPYYINLSSSEAERMEKNIGYVLKSCAAAQAMGADHLVVHCGGVGKQSRDRAFQNTIVNVRAILQAVQDHGYTQTICLETMGKQSVIGSAEEICTLVALDDRLLPALISATSTRAPADSTTAPRRLPHCLTAWKTRSATSARRISTAILPRLNIRPRVRCGI